MEGVCVRERLGLGEMCWDVFGKVWGLRCEELDEGKGRRVGSQ